MKQITGTLVLAGALGLALMSCAGDDGATGPAGPAGSANVQYSAWFSPAAWTGTGTPNNYFDRAAVEVTQPILDSGVVLAWARLAGDGGAHRPLPGTTSPGFLILWNHFETPGNIRFTGTAVDGTTNWTASTNNSFRYVIIPGGVALSAIAPGPDGRDSDRGETIYETLRRMSYEEVCAMFDIPEDGSSF